MIAIPVSPKLSMDIVSIMVRHNVIRVYGNLYDIEDDRDSRQEHILLGWGSR